MSLTSYRAAPPRVRPEGMIFAIGFLYRMERSVSF